MTATTNLKQLKLNIVTQQQYDSMTKNANELYAVTDANISYKELSDKPAVTSLPTAASTNEGDIYQYIGVTDQYYTHGYFYECVSDGAVTPTYSWEQIDVQPAGSSLPSQTGNAGKFLTTDGTDALWGNALQNTATGTDSLSILGTASAYVNTVNVGVDSVVNGQVSVAVGKNSRADAQSVAIGPHTQTASMAVAIGRGAKVTAPYGIQIGGYDQTNSETGTLYIGSYYYGAINYKLLDVDGTIPTDRFTTTPSADGTYVPTLTISSGTATRSWAAPSSGGSSSTTVTLAVNDWSSNTQTVNATEVTASNNVIVAAAPSSQTDYTNAGILCTAQGAGTLTFTCTTVPSSAIDVNVLIFN